MLGAGDWCINRKTFLGIGCESKSAFKSHSRPAGPWQESKRFLPKNYLRAYYLWFDWSGWIVLTKTEIPPGWSDLKNEKRLKLLTEFYKIYKNSNNPNIKR